MRLHNPSVWTKYVESRLYGYREPDLITKTWCKFNIVGKLQKWGHGQVTYAQLTYTLHIMINAWTRYSEPRLYGYVETDLITKTWLKFSKSVDCEKKGQGNTTHTWMTYWHYRDKKSNILW
jgi:hypothetical protein